MKYCENCACGKVEYRCCYALMRIINEKLK